MKKCKWCCNPTEFYTFRYSKGKLKRNIECYSCACKTNKELDNMEIGQKFDYNANGKTFTALFMGYTDEGMIKAVITDNMRFRGVKVEIQKDQIL